MGQLEAGDTFLVDMGGKGAIRLHAVLVADQIGAIVVPLDPTWRFDATCVLTAADHSPLKDETVVVYEHHRALHPGQQATLTGLWNYQPRKRLSSAALDKIRKGAISSRHIPRDFKDRINAARKAA